MRSLEQTARDLEEGRTAARDLIEESLARIADPAGQGGLAFRRVHAEAARASAEAIDTLRRAGRAPSRYAGIPVSLKDLFDVAGEPTQGGSTILADAPPAIAHAAVVARLLAAGLIPIGRTAMTEFAFSGIGANPHFGTPLSPWDRATGRIPGGSSSGAAVSVSDGMVAAALGTDTGGSCRIPAAFCGITGFKPTARRVPLAGVLPLAPSLDSVGPLAATAADCAAIDAIIADPPADRPDPPDRASLRLLAPTNLVLEDMDETVAEAFGRALGRLERAGARITRTRLHALDRIGPAQRAGSLAAAEAFAGHRLLLEQHEARYDPRVARRILAGNAIDAGNLIALQTARRAAIAEFAAEAALFDAVVLPTVVIVPPPLAALGDESEYWRLNSLCLRNTSAANFLDGCAISLPCHRPGEPPVGLMLMAPAMQDARLLALAQAVQEG